MLQTEQDIIELIKEDEWMMDVLVMAKQLQLPDWWICAGFVRSKIWDTLHHFQARTIIPDIDVIYFDPSNISKAEEKRLEGELRRQNPTVPWSVKNQARMHLANGIARYTSSVDAISKFPETATALGVKLDEEDNLLLTAPCGLSDVLNLEVRPTRYFAENDALKNVYHERVAKKNWQDKWNKVRVFQIE
ncbi:nucleotidyltransferase family protein [Metabacillus malikii]|uniref:Nucleotidyltransferase family protein n=1 Tax=Metabacillus malikii TaxID=1504265 RepID=A0ABT9ZB24_9BACI|nr:nucleotidyltransferase family protein [Metabacillus malikii]MDQ0229042.1 hypothetical protein [Metabacillus malikii]